MKALELTRSYWEQTAAPALQHSFPTLYPRVAAGLVGNGSECFGFDDEQSMDHDWGVDFFLWVTEADRDALPDLIRWKQSLFAQQPPPAARDRTAYGGTVSCMTVGEFYESLTGFPGAPEDVLDWRLAPEENFALAVNGAVFYDGAGAFSAVRRSLLDYYPEDLRRKKIAARCAAIAQTGQYNFARMVRREDWVTVHTVLERFSQEVMGLVFHLNRVYRPYYKWVWRRLGELPVLGVETASLLLELTLIEGRDESAQQTRQALIDRICALLTSELRRQGLSHEQDDFLLTHAEAVQRTIRNEALRLLPVQYE